MIQCSRRRADLTGGSLFCSRCGLAFAQPVPSDEKSQEATPISQASFSALNLPARPNPKPWPSDTATVLFLIFFFPVGLILLWIHPGWQRRTKWAVTGAIGVLLLSITLYNVSPAGRAAQAAQDQQDAIAAVQEKAADAQQAKQDALDAIPEPQRRFSILAQFPEVLKLVDKQTNDDPPLPKLRSFKHDPQISTVSIEVNMDQNFPDNMTNTGVEMEVADLYTALLHGGSIKPKIAEVRVFGPLVDKFGHTETSSGTQRQVRAHIARDCLWNCDG